MFHNKTERVYPILWCAYICRATSTDCHALRGVKYKGYTNKST